MAQPAEAVPAPCPSRCLSRTRQAPSRRSATAPTPCWTRRNHGRPARAVGRRELRGPRGRVAIVDGCRTPFVKAGTDLPRHGRHRPRRRRRRRAGRAHRPRREGDRPRHLRHRACRRSTRPNLGREVVFRCSLPEWIPGTAVNLACASSNRAITSAAEAILVGEADVVLAGGAESLSNVPIRFSDAAAKRLMELHEGQEPAAEGGDPRQAPAEGPGAGAAGDRRVHDRHDHGRGGREDGEGERHLAPRAGRDRPAVAPARRGGDARGALRRADRAGLPAAAPTTRRCWSTTACATTPSSSKLAGAAAGVRQALRHAHRRQRQPDHRRRLRRAADERGEGEGARLRAARLHPLVGVRRRSTPRTQLLQGPAYAAPEALDARRRDARRHRPRRDARGVRGAGALQPEGVRLAEVRGARSWAGARRSARSTSTSSTSTAARSRSATRSAPPARG